MKKFFNFIIVVIGVFLVYKYKDEISTYILKNYIYKQEIVVQDISKYKLNYNYAYVKETNDFIIKNDNDLKNSLYSIINNGWNDFSFYCDNNYMNCIDDLNEITGNNNNLATLNNFVHPFNSYESINITYNNLGKINVKINNLYKKDDIVLLEEKTNEIIKNIITDDMSDRDKILKIHNYIINNTKYDSEHAWNITNNLQVDNNYKSHTAIGPLINGMGICGGYSDAMSLFLNKFNIPNYKIANNDHIWNFVYIDGKWLHLDLTWDDPVVNTKEDLLLHNYFLITTDELVKLNDNNHNYNKKIYIEAH